MFKPRTRLLILTAAAVTAATTGSALAGAAGNTPTPAPSGPASRSWTPNDCIRLNHGDYQACNVGNSGRGDLPYRPPASKGNLTHS